MSWPDQIAAAAKGRRGAWEFRLPAGGHVRGHVLARWLRAWPRPERDALPPPVVLAREGGDRLVIRAERASLSLRITGTPYRSRRKRRAVVVHWPPAVPIVDLT